MEMREANSSESANARCENCGRPLDLRCEDCGCPVSCHDFVYSKEGERQPYCKWDFAACPTEQRSVFLAAIEEWLREVHEMQGHLPRRG